MLHAPRLVARKAVAPARSGWLSPLRLASLLFPELEDGPLMGRLASDAAAVPENGVSAIRRMIASVDQQTSASPFIVRFGPEDVKRVDAGGFSLLVDVCDTSVSPGLLSPGGYEPHLTAVFQRYCAKGMTVVDVGANVGYYTLLASRLVGPSGKVIAIEPNSENCRLLLSSVRESGASNVELFPIAARDTGGWAFFSSHLGSNGGILAPSSDFVARRGAVVAAFPLDELLGGRRIDLIKLDVEGAEALVVEGARCLIETCRPIVTTELSREMLGRVSGVGPEEYLGWFDDLGYSLFLIERSGQLIPFANSGELLGQWDDLFRIEDLLLLPPQPAR